MAQHSYEVTNLPESAIDASAAFHAEHLDAVRTLIGTSGDDCLAIILPPAAADHADWRRAIARDLARAQAPARVNVIAGSSASELAALREYLAGAKGITGHYLETHE